MTHRLTLIAAATLSTLILSGCDDEYYNGGGGYYPPPHDYDAPRKELIDNCKGKVREKVRKRIGYGAKIDWGKIDMYNSGRYETTINGKGKARNNGRKHKLFYSCKMNRRDGWVRSARIELDGDVYGGDGANWDKKAVRACKERIRYQAERNIHQEFSMEFTRHHVSTPAERRRHVSGEAKLHGNNGNGKIAYDCRLHVNPLRIDNAGYRWLKPLPATGGSGSYQPGISNKDAKHRCHQNLKNRLKRLGYHKIRFPGSSVRDIGNNRKQVDIRVHALIENGNRAEESYRCRINSRNGRVLSMDRIR